MTEKKGLDPNGIVAALDRADGVYLVIKDRNSTIIWVNENFAKLVGQKKEELIGFTDSRAEHVAHDKAVIASGVPLLNLHETIPVPQLGDIPIITQKGLLRDPSTNEITGITVCFAKDDIQKSAQDWIKQLDLKPTGVGGYFAPIAESNESISNTLPARFGEHTFYSANYFLLDGKKKIFSSYTR